MSTSEILIQILTMIIALYAAIFSTVLAIQQGRNRITVSCRFDTLTTAEGTENVVEVCGVNVGNKTLEIREVGFRDEYGTTLSKQFDPLTRLEPGMSIRQHFAYEVVLEKLDTYTSVFAEDNRGRSYSADMDSHRKDLIRYGPVIEASITLGETLLRANKQFDEGVDRIEQQIEQTLRRLDEIGSDGLEKVNELQRKRKEWDDYRARTGETHPEEQEFVDETLRYIDSVKPADRVGQADEGESEEGEDDEQRQDT